MIWQERLNRITQFVSEVSLDHIPSSPKVYNQEDECSPSKGRSWMDSAIRVDGTLALSAVSAGIIEDVLTSPSKLRINSPNNRNSDASDKRWEYLGKVEMSSLPALPKHRELMTRLGPLHARLSSDKTSAKKHPSIQIDDATQFLAAMRQHLESLCSNLSNHTITNVQNNDRVSLLLKESYIDFFSYRDRPFVREFVDTQIGCLDSISEDLQMPNL
ncbi:hypothetical protein Tco_1270497 [Tanacetum coccineum]